MTTREAIRQAQRSGRFREAADLYAALDRENEQQMKSQTRPLDLVIEWIEPPAKPAAESNREYHADHRHVSNSMLSVFKRSQVEYRGRFVTGEMPAPEPTAAMAFGSAVHISILEPDKECFVQVRPKFDRRTKAGKDAYSDWQNAISADSIIIDQNQYEQWKRTVDAVRSNEMAMALLNGCETEKTIRWHDEINRKCRIDALGSDAIIDLKTTADASEKGFAKSVANFGYHRQAAWYQNGVDATEGESRPFVFIAAQTSEPYSVGIYYLSPDAIERGRNENRELVRRLLHCMESGEWRETWQRELTEIDLPRWAYK